MLGMFLMLLPVIVVLAAFAGMVAWRGMEFVLLFCGMLALMVGAMILVMICIAVGVMLLNLNGARHRKQKEV
jgi:hypothetical protein